MQFGWRSDGSCCAVGLPQSVISFYIKAVCETPTVNAMRVIPLTHISDTHWIKGHSVLLLCPLVSYLRRRSGSEASLSARWNWRKIKLDVGNGKQGYSWFFNIAKLSSKFVQNIHIYIYIYSSIHNHNNGGIKHVISFCFLLSLHTAVGKERTRLNDCWIQQIRHSYFSAVIRWRQRYIHKSWDQNLQ
jgi:hypothetical protein